jgi:hypothetical protein
VTGFAKQEDVLRLGRNSQPGAQRRLIGISGLPGRADRQSVGKIGKEASLVATQMTSIEPATMFLHQSLAEADGEGQSTQTHTAAQGWARVFILVTSS